VVERQGGELRIALGAAPRLGQSTRLPVAPHRQLPFLGRHRVDCRDHRAPVLLTQRRAHLPVELAIGEAVAGTREPIEGLGAVPHRAGHGELCPHVSLLLAEEQRLDLLEAGRRHCGEGLAQLDRSEQGQLALSAGLDLDRVALEILLGLKRRLSATTEPPS
jgi:hypothetical protein